MTEKKKKDNREMMLLGGSQACPTLGTPWTMACQAPLSMGVFQPRILEWVAISFSRGSLQLTD